MRTRVRRRHHVRRTHRIRHRRNYGTRVGYVKGVSTFERRHKRHVSPAWFSRKAGRLPRFTLNPRRRRRHTYRRNPGLAFYAGRRRSLHRRRHSYRRNPLSLGGVGSSFKQLLNKEFIIDAATVAGGALGTSFVTSYALNKLGKSAWATGIPGYAANVVVAGLLGTAAMMLRKPRLARNIMLGGVAFVVGKAANDYLMPALGQPSAPTVAGSVSGLGSDDEIRSLVSREVKGYLSGYLSPSNQTLSGYAQAGSPILSGLDISTL